MNDYIKSGRFDYVPGVNKDDFLDEEELEKALTRRKVKIHQTDFVIQPRQIHETLHKKSHFKAGEAISLDIGTMKITTRLFNEDFINIAKKITDTGNQFYDPSNNKVRSPK